MGWDGPVTHRQYLTWQQWLDDQWNKPDRSDHYQMQTACEVKRVLAKNPGSIQPNDFKIPFKFEEEKPAKEQWHPFPPLTKETIAKVQSAIARAGMLKIVKAAGVKRG